MINFVHASSNDTRSGSGGGLGRCCREERRQVAALSCLQLGHHGVAFGRVGRDHERQQRAHQLYTHTSAASATRCGRSTISSAPTGGNPAFSLTKLAVSFSGESE